MRWEEVQKSYPEQWVLIEAIGAHTEEAKRIVDQITVVDSFADDSSNAMRQYIKLHRQYRQREFYVVHTSRQELDINDKPWIGVRARV